MSKYERIFESIGGEEFRADVYSVLAAFGVKCPARQHAIKKLLMPGQRGAKSEVQDLKEALASVSRAIDMAQARLPDGGTLTGETEAEPEPESEPGPKPKPKMVVWRLYARLAPWLTDENFLEVHWFPSGDIPEYWYPIEAHTQPVETVKKLPEGEKP